MPNIDDLVTQAMVRYFIHNAFSIKFDYRENFRRVDLGGELYFLSTPSVWEKVFKLVEPVVTQSRDDTTFTIRPHVKSIRKEALNVWRAEVDLRYYNMRTDALTVQSYVMNMSIRYFPERVKMARTFMNPLGFTVVEFNQSRVYNTK